jgi:hypothetical protein
LKTNGLKFPPLLRIYVFVSLGILLAGALGWLFGTYILEGHEGWGNAALNVEFWSLKIHGAGIMLSLIALGASLGHLQSGLKNRRYEYGGIALLALFGFLIFSGWLLYYGPTSEWHDRISKIHWITGLATAAAFIFHLYFWRERPKRRGRA